MDKALLTGTVVQHQAKQGNINILVIRFRFRRYSSHVDDVSGSTKTYSVQFNMANGIFSSTPLTPKCRTKNTARFHW